MNANESFSILAYERQKILLLLLIHIQLARGVKEDRIEIIQILGVATQLLLGDELRVGFDVRVVDTRLSPHPFNGRQGVRNRIVLEALDRADCEKLFLLWLSGEGERQSDSEEKSHRDAKHDHEDSTVGQASWPVRCAC